MQIRVHLKYLGHPIANDMLYLSENFVDRSIEGTSADRAVVNSGHCMRPGSDQTCPSEHEENCSEDFSIDSMCTNCPNLAPKG